MNVDVFMYDGEGISWVYKNKKWVLCIKNWKPDNDINGIHCLEKHHETDEQFILLNGKAILLVADRINGKFDIEMIEMEPLKVYNVPQNTWFYTITQKDTKMVYVQDAGTSIENSEFCDLSASEIMNIRKKAKEIFNK